MSHAIAKKKKEKKIYVKYLHVTVACIIERLLCTLCANGFWPHFEIQGQNKMLDWLLIKCFHMPHYINLVCQRKNSMNSCD